MKSTLLYFSKLKDKHLFFLISALLFVLMMAISNDYGVTNDEPIHQVHGKVLLDYFKGNSNTAALSPIDSTGKIILTFEAEEDSLIHGMNFFGGSFDLAINFLKQYFPNVGIYEFRHRLTAILGFTLFLFSGLIVSRLLNWKSAIFALLLTALSPQLFGHAFNNPKDIPFATLYIIALYLIIRIIQCLPKFSIKNASLLAAVIALSIDIRVSGLLLITYLFAGLFFAWLSEFKKEQKYSTWLLFGLKLFAYGLGISLVSYFASLILWPYAHTNFLAPIDILVRVSNFSGFNAFELYNYQWHNATEIPSSYPIVWIYYASPLLISAGTYLSLLLFIKKFNPTIPKSIIALLWLSLAFPIFFIIYKHSNIYNGIRHLLFIFPLLSILTSLTLYQVYTHLKSSKFYYVFILAIVLGIADPLIFMVKNHPYQSMYFSRVEGGTRAAFKRFELDYWGLSTKKAVSWIAENSKNRTKDKPVIIYYNFNEPKILTYYTDQYKNIFFATNSSNIPWDYEIIFPTQAKFDANILINWPPKGTVHQIYVDSAPMCAIVKNIGQVSSNSSSLESELSQNLTENQCIELSLKFYQKGDFVNCVWACNKTLKLNPNNFYAYNNMGSALNEMKMFDAAVQNLKIALRINPTFTNAINNLALSEKELKKKPKLGDLINASYYAFRLFDYTRCITYSKEILLLDSKNIIALNNIGSAYNALENYSKGAEYCKKALAIDPNYILAKNNLAVALEHLKK